MKRMTYFVMALALVLGFTQCKKEQPTPQTQGVRITLNVNGGNSNSRVIVDPNGNNGQYNYATVNFESGDVIYVGYNNAYVGTLTYSNGTFSGTVNISEIVGDEHLHFYFLGGVGFEPTVDGNTATVVISDQTQKLPVISYSPSKEVFTTTNTSYSAKLQNKISIMKFNVTTPSTAPICITGMNNKVTVDFTAPSGTDNGFAYDKDGEGVIKMQGVTTENTETWAIVLPQAALEAGGEGTVYTADNAYTGTRPAMNAIAMNTFINGGFALTVNTEVAPAGNTVDLSNLTGNYEAQDGDILSGTLANNVKISIAAEASVTLSNININENGNWIDGEYAGITCLGNATIILEGTNTVRAFNSKYPGVQAGPTGTTLTIEGSGTLNATGGSDGAAGIGSGMNASCGNITINGGTIVATGGPNGAGIGTGYTNAQGSGNISCGIITITGGTVTAYGGENAAGIGTGQSRHGTQIRRNECGGVNISGGMVMATGGENGAGIGSGYGRGTRYNPISYCGDINITGGTVVATGGSNSAGIGTGNTYTFGNSNCGNITITPGVTSVTATKSTGARDSIGRGKGKGTCGTVMFGDETIYDGSLWIIAPESGSAYGGLSFFITTVTNTDDTWVLQP